MKALVWSLAKWSIACISGGRWLGTGRKCRRRPHEARNTDATHLRREDGAGGGVSCVAFPTAAWTVWRGIVFSPVSALVRAKGSVKELPWTTGGLHHSTLAALSCQTSGQQGISDVERLDKELEIVAAAIHQFAC